MTEPNQTLLQKLLDQNLWPVESCERLAKICEGEEVEPAFQKLLSYWFLTDGIINAAMK